MFNYFKNFMITFLVALAVYQTNKLWFEDFSSHNFFYPAFYERLNQNTADEIRNETEYAAVNNGTNRFTLYCDNSAVEPIRSQVIKLAKTAADKGEALDFDYEELKNILKGRSIVIHYSFFVAPSVFSGMYKSKSLNLPVFDSIGINDGGTDGFRVVFFNSQGLDGAEYSLSDYSDGDEIRSIIDGAKQNSGGIYYISSVLNNYEVFSGNEFIPTWAGEASYNSITKTNPAAENGALTSASIDSFANSYFANPVLKWTSVDDKAYTFSDENTVVKYYTATGVMEYASYFGSTGDDKTSFGTGLAAAESFLRSESALKNDWYLSGYEYDGDRIIYYFDYKINNLLLKLSEDMKEKLGMRSFIEITADGSRVTKYKRYVMDYAASVKDPIYTEKSYLEVIDKGLSLLGGDMINSLKISYLETGEAGIPLSYVADIDGKYYTETVY